MTFTAENILLVGSVLIFSSILISKTHLTLIDYLNEGVTTRNHRASLHERFRIMCRHYGYLSTLARHAWFALRLLLKK